MGSSTQKVLADKDSKNLFSVSSLSREHITACYTVSAAVEAVPVRCILCRVRNIAEQKLKDLPCNGKTGIQFLNNIKCFNFAILGKWGLSVSPKGFINQDLYLTVLTDLNSVVTQKKIKKPVLLFIDVASPHLSLKAAKYCIDNEIQPWLLRPNSTHLLQVSINVLESLNFF